MFAQLATLYLYMCMCAGFNVCFHFIINSQMRMCACTTTSLLFMSLLHYGGVRNISLLLLLLFYYNFFFNIHVVVFVCLYALERHTITFISQQLRSLPSYRRVNHNWVCTFHFVLFFFSFFFSYYVCFSQLISHSTVFFDCWLLLRVCYK